MIRHRCNHCGGSFPPEGFYWANRARSGRSRSSYCKQCDKDRISRTASPEAKRRAQERFRDKLGGQEAFNQYKYESARRNGRG